MIEFTVKDRVYRTCRMSAFQQLHVTRRILPLLAKIPDMIGKTLEEIVADPQMVITWVMENLGEIKLDVIAETIAGLNQEDVDYILNTCLDSTQIKDPQGTGWGRIRQNGVVMYNHIVMHEMLGIAANVIKDNLGDFFGGSAPASPVAGTGTATAE